MPQTDDNTVVVVLDFDPATLVAEGITLGKDLFAVAEGFPDTECYYKSISSRSNLKQAIDEIPTQTHILVWIGHGLLQGPLSPAVGMRLNKQERSAISWADLGRLVRPLNPESIIIASCSSGRTKATRELFSVLKGLEDVVGAATVHTASEMRLALEWMLRILIVAPEHFNDLRNIPVLVNLIANKGLILWQSRDGFLESDGEQDGHWDSAEALLAWLVRRFTGRN